MQPDVLTIEESWIGSDNSSVTGKIGSKVNVALWAELREEACSPIHCWQNLLIFMKLLQSYGSNRASAGTYAFTALITYLEPREQFITANISTMRENGQQTD